MQCINVRFLEEELTGVGRFSTEITKRLLKIYPEAYLIAPKTIKTPEGWNINTKGSLKGALWEQLQMPFFLPNKYDWCFNPANTCSLLAKNNITVVHDIIPLTNPEWYSLQARWYYKMLLPLVIKRSKAIITVSEYNKKEIHEFLGSPLEKIHVVYNGVDPFWKPVKEEPAISNYILTVASFDPRKNLKRLIDAFRLLKDKSLKLVVVGHKHKAFAEMDLQLTEQDKQRIIFTGYVSDEEVRKLYSHAKAFVYPSLKEGFGIPPLEAMACGTPVIVSHTASLPEVCGEAALYIEPLNTETIITAIHNILENPRLTSQLVEKGKENVSKFSWDIACEKISLILESQK